MAEFDVRFGSGIPEDVVSAPPGSIWIQNSATPPRSTLWRKLTGTGAAGWIRSELSVFNIRDFGAQCDDTDDTQAWFDAIDAAHLVSGVVFHPGATNDPSKPPPSVTSGVSLIQQELVVPNDSSIQFIGGPRAILRATSNFPAGKPMLTINSAPGGAGSRYGAIRDLRIEGGVSTGGQTFAKYADIGLQVYAVQREFENLDIRNCKHIGLYVRGAQNCTFLSCNVENNGTEEGAIADANCVLDLGAGNNAFYRCQFSPTYNSNENGPHGTWNLVIRQSAPSPSGAFAQPEANTFDACQFERSSISHLGALLQSAGRNNTFNSCTFQTSASRKAIVINNADGRPSVALRLTNCRLSGTFEDSIAVSADLGAPPDPFAGPAAIVDNTFLENFSVGFEVSASTGIDVAMPLHAGAISGDLVDNLTPGPWTKSRLVSQRSLMFDEMPSDDHGRPLVQFNTAPWYYDVGRHLIHVYGHYQGNNHWRSVDLVQQEIYETDPPVTTTSTASIYNVGIRYHRIIVGEHSSTNITITIGNPAIAAVGMRLHLDFYNLHTGAGTTAYAFGTAYRLNALTTVAANTHTILTFEYDGDKWREVARVAGQPN